MSEGAITVLDGTQLRDIDLSPPFSDGAVTGAQVLDLADSTVSSSLFGIALPGTLRSSTLNTIGLHDIVAFRQSQLTPERASEILKDYVSAIADGLRDDPLLVSILDGNTLHIFLDDEDDFAMLAETLFTDLDTEDKGKIKKSEIKNALIHMGVETGVPPLSEYPLLSDILQKHEVESSNELGQAQFAEVLQAVLQELADTLAKKPYVFIQNIKITNGAQIKKLLADEKQFNDVIEKLWQWQGTHKEEDGVTTLQKIRNYFEKEWKELGLPPTEANEAVVLLYDAIFADIAKEKCGSISDKNQFEKLAQEILEIFVEQLEVSPVYYDCDCK
ncbi:uncharacterized protein LOC120080587 [Benincasa hispida]|uniref:uncharacterized protein LOC120080587 n=1 Tax=Benincasa hispida TaxID=102211 RepID=UPI001900A3D1|nr:uncharacterized protein LOC120080587 [Benincasa hispida]